MRDYEQGQNTGTGASGTGPTVLHLPVHDPLEADVEFLRRNIGRLQEYYSLRSKLYFSFISSLVEQGMDPELAVEAASAEFA